MTDSVGLRDGDLIADEALRRSADDAFGHTAIAGRAAELCCQEQMPLRIALFGPWGSGKSSEYELLRDALTAHKDLRLVRYDASAFGGQALQRNFISHVASELGVLDDDSKEHRPFHKGLYEKRRSSSLDFERARDELRGLALLTGVVYGALLVIFALLAGLASVATREDFVGQIVASMPHFIAPSAVAAVALALGKAILDGGKIETEEGQPSEDEQFARRLADLLDLVEARDGFKRFVFFIDELDRCSAQDIVATLTALRTLLDHPRCVYIVAADRAVLEASLSDLPQVTPVDTVDPYYSSAGSYFDKIFHHTIELPPLRGQRLYSFARDLVGDAGGVWEQLRDGAEPSLDRVIYALVPSHVRSPRRVKHLLNHFATQTRIIEARGIAWRDRAAEVAKLSVLRVEFPILAADLPYEPRLPSLLLDPPTEASSRVADLLRKHGVDIASTGGSATETADAEDASSVPADRLLVDDPPPELLSTERRNLMRYLHRVAGVSIPDPRRDLLYLEPAGVEVGLEDPELAEILEAEAADRPDVVIRAVAERPAEQQVAAALVLASMADGARGDERGNIIDALLGVLGDLADAGQPAWTAAMNAVRGFGVEEGLRDRQLPAVLSLALRADDNRMVEQLFERDVLLTGQQLRQTAAQLRNLPKDLRERVTAAVAATIPQDADFVFDLLDDADDADAAKLLSDDAIEEQLIARLKLGPSANPALDATVERVGQVAERPQTALKLHWLLLRAEVGYTEVREHVPALLDALHQDQPRASHALVALRDAPAEDWPMWSNALTSTPKEWDAQGRRARAALGAQLQRVGEVVPDGLTELAQALQPYLKMVADDDVSNLSAALTNSLAARLWWSTEERLADQLLLYKVARVVADAVPETKSELDGTLLADVRRSISPVASWTALTVKGYSQLGRLLDAESAAVAMQDLAGPIDAALAPDVAGARIWLALTTEDLALVTLEDLEEASKTTAGTDAVSAWLERTPPADSVVGFIKALDEHVSQRLLRAISRWAASTTTDERTRAVLGVVRKVTEPEPWVRALGTAPIDELAFVDLIDEGIKEATRAEQRQRLVESVRSRPLEVVEARRRLVGVIEGLLSTGKRGDFDLASSLVASLGSEHRGGRRLSDAFEDASEKQGHKVEKKYLDDFAAAGIALKQRSLTDEARSLWRAIRGK
jgi:hypothetical protein